MTDLIDSYKIVFEDLIRLHKIVKKFKKEADLEYESYKNNLSKTEKEKDEYGLIHRNDNRCWHRGNINTIETTISYIRSLVNDVITDLHYNVDYNYDDVDDWEELQKLINKLYDEYIKGK